MSGANRGIYFGDPARDREYDRTRRSPMHRALIGCLAIFLAVSSELCGSRPARAQPTLRPRHLPATMRTDKPLSVAQRIDQALIHYHFVGSILIAQHGKIIFKHGYGRSGLRSSSALNSALTVYNAGDITVPMTVSAVLQLQEQG